MNKKQSVHIRQTGQTGWTEVRVASESRNRPIMVGLSPSKTRTRQAREAPLTVQTTNTSGHEFERERTWPCVAHGLNGSYNKRSHYRTIMIAPFPLVFKRPGPTEREGGVPAWVNFQYFGHARPRTRSGQKPPRRCSCRHLGGRPCGSDPRPHRRGSSRSRPRSCAPRLNVWVPIRLPPRDVDHDRHGRR